MTFLLGTLSEHLWRLNCTLTFNWRD